MELMVRARFVTMCFIIIPSILAAFKPADPRDVLAKKRADQLMGLVEKRSCIELTAQKNCTRIKKQPLSSMNLYMASKLEKADGTLTMKVPMKPNEIFTDLDAVVIIDPIPDAHFGHTLLVALIKTSITKSACEHRKKNGIYYQTVNGQFECMYLPQHRRCHLMAQLMGGRKKRPCSINYIPFVYDVADIGQKQQLRCFSNFGFKTCPITKTAPNPCKNTANCKYNRGRENAPCHWSCDHAVMISGGWNKYINRIRHLRNMRSFYNHLFLHRSFHKDNIKVFFANNASIELNNDAVAQDTIPAVDASSIVQHVKEVCSKDTKCIDTFVIYLNGPATSSGDLLLWDFNQDGVVGTTETLSISNLLAPLRDCNAKNYLLIVDQNFAGHFIEHVKKGRALKYRNFENIHVLTASNKQSLSWKRDFTEKFIEYDNNHIDSQDAPTFARRISYIAKDLMKSPSLKQYKINYLEGSNKDLTITGYFGQESGCTFQNIGAKG